MVMSYAAYTYDISIHALREEGDQAIMQGVYNHIEFLSTPSARRATPQDKTDAYGQKNFYPRPPRGGRRWHKWRFFYFSHISIHALREEGDHSVG